MALYALRLEILEGENAKLKTMLAQQMVHVTRPNETFVQCF
jgi:hypothetical protein